MHNPEGAFRVSLPAAGGLVEDCRLRLGRVDLPPDGRGYEMLTGLSWRTGRRKDSKYEHYY